MTRLKRTIALPLVGVVLCFGAVIPAYCKELTLFIWDEYISEAVLEGFRNETGITVRQVHFDSDKIRDEIVASARGKEFDVVVFESNTAQVFGRSNQLLAVSASEIPSLTHVDRRWQESCGNFGVAYFYGTLGLVYDTTRYAEQPDSWSDLLKPGKEHQGNVVMVEDRVDTLAPALLYLGYNINSENTDELKAAYELLEQQVPAVLNYKYSLSNIKVSDMAGRMDLALAYSGDQYALNEATGTENWAYVIPREGTAIWVDCLSVTAWSKNRKEALMFLNYMSAPKNGAVNAAEIRSATPIIESRRYMSKADAASPELFPPWEILRKGQLYHILSNDNMRLRGRILDTLLKKHETQ